MSTAKVHQIQRPFGSALVSITAPANACAAWPDGNDASEGRPPITIRAGHNTKGRGLAMRGLRSRSLRNAASSREMNRRTTASHLIRPTAPHAAPVAYQTSPCPPIRLTIHIRTVNAGVRCAMAHSVTNRSTCMNQVHTAVTFPTTFTNHTATDGGTLSVLGNCMR